MRRIVRWLGAISGALVALMVVIHLPPVRRWLGAHGHHGAGVCPLGYGGAPPSAEQTARVHASQRGPTAARERPALGFALDATTADDVMRWAGEHGVACAPHGRTIECSGVPAALVGGGALAVTSLWFELDARGRLDAIRTVRRDGDAGRLASAYAAIEADLAARAGTPVTTDGSPAPDVLASGALRQAAATFRFTNYRAVVRATNMGDGFVLTEEYATLVD